MLNMKNMIAGEQFLQQTYQQRKPSVYLKIDKLKLYKLKHEEKEQEWGTESQRAGRTYQVI